MTNEQIIECNKLIAEFMGWRKNKEGFWLGSLGVFYELKFNTSWNLLMPVVQKIKQLYPEWSGFVEPKIFDLVKAIETVDMGKIWLAVVEFIKWYNNQNK